jgi:hypothetical protein
MILQLVASLKRHDVSVAVVAPNIDNGAWQKNDVLVRDMSPNVYVFSVGAHCGYSLDHHTVVRVIACLDAATSCRTLALGDVFSIARHAQVRS